MRVGFAPAPASAVFLCVRPANSYIYGSTTAGGDEELDWVSVAASPAGQDPAGIVDGNYLEGRDVAISRTDVDAIAFVGQRANAVPCPLPRGYTLPGFVVDAEIAHHRD